MADRSLIAWSLETAAERHGDPTPLVYERLFAQSPEMEALFIMDKQGSVRGNMLANVFEVLLDLAGPRAYGVHMVRAEIVNHENLGVPPQVFATFFGTVRDTIAAMLGDDWTPDVAAAWAEVMAELDGMARSPATA
jgi:hemoglobin-like flavoprotein